MYDTGPCDACTQPARGKCRGICSSTNAQCRRHVVSGAGFCWQHLSSDSHIKLRPIKRDEVPELYYMQSKINACWFFNGMSLAQFVRLCMKEYTTLVLLVGSRIYGFVLFEYLPDVLDHKVVYVAYRCSLASFYDEKPPVSVGYAMWTALVGLMRRIHSRRLLAFVNFSISTAVHHHQSNCMSPIPPTFRAGLERTVWSAASMNMSYFSKGVNYDRPLPQWHTPCLVPTIPGAVVNTRQQKYKVRTAKYNEYVNNSLVRYHGFDRDVLLDRDKLQQLIGRPVPPHRPRAVSLFEKLTADTDYGSIPVDRMSELDDALN